MDPNLTQAIAKISKAAKAAGVPEFLLGIMKYVATKDGPRPDIIIHREHLTTKAALMIAIQSVHFMIDGEIERPGISGDEIRVLAGFKKDMNSLVKATDKALVAAQNKQKK